MRRRGCPLEFRRKALDLVESGRAIAKVARRWDQRPSRSTPGVARTASARRTVRPDQPGAQPANLGEPWPNLQQPEGQVHRMQAKLHQWAKAGPAVAFHDLHNLVCDRRSSWWRGAGHWATERRHRQVRWGGSFLRLPPKGAEPRTPSLSFASLAHPGTPTRSYHDLIVVGPRIDLRTRLDCDRSTAGGYLPRAYHTPWSRSIRALALPGPMTPRWCNSTGH